MGRGEGLCREREGPEERVGHEAGFSREPRLLNKAVIRASVSSSLLILDIIFLKKCCTCRGEELETGCES